MAGALVEPIPIVWSEPQTLGAGACVEYIPNCPLQEAGILPDRGYQPLENLSENSDPHDKIENESGI